MMDHVFCRKRSIRGAISVFLIIIFLATYMLSAVLVDGGRYRMAQVMAETALDSAAESVLSHYNQMMYDLYGIFAVDSASVGTDKIAEVMKTYVTKTLGVADVDYSGYSTMLSNFILEGDWKAGENKPYFDDYDFNVTITGGASVTLASTDYVEDQIIDYMKYRAPLSLAAGAGSFFKKLEAIVNMKDRIEASMAQIKATKDHKDLFKESDTLMKDLNIFNGKVIAYCSNPDGDLGSMSFSGDVGANAADLYEKFGKPFDDKLNEIANLQVGKIPSDFEGGPAPTGGEDAEFARLARYQEQEYEEAKKNFLDSYKPVFDNAGTLYEEAVSLRERIDTVNQKYTQYIAELQAKMDEKPDNEEYKTVFLPEIELAKANCGEILKNVDLLSSTKRFTLSIKDLGGNWSAFETAVSGLVDHRLNGGSPASLKAAVDGTDAGMVAETSRGYIKEPQENLNHLMEQAGYFYKCHKAEVKVENVEEISAKNEKKEEETAKPANLTKEHLEVNYTPTETAGEGERYSLKEDKVKTDEAEGMLGAGLSLISKIGELLEGVRDNIYVNEYIMSTFPNVVEDKEEPKGLSELAKKRREYDATYAGVEYILHGKMDSTENVLFVDAELLGIRTIFNTAAIFTDTAKRHQATAFASAISGPFAPIVAIALLIAWAVAESVMDVLELKEGKEVALFKRGGEWTFSIESALKQCISSIAQKMGDEITNKLSALKDNLQDKMSGVIYDVYNTAEGTMDGAIHKCKEKISEFCAPVNDDPSSAVLNAAMSELNSTLAAEIDTVRGTVSTWAGDQRDKAIKTVNEAMDKAYDKTSAAIENGLKSVGENVSSSLLKWVPKGKVVNTGGNSIIKLSYVDYVHIFLLMMNQQTKIQRVQSLIQANMIHGGNSDFKMENSSAAVWGEMECSIRYLFMGDSILPANVKREERLTFKVYSARSY